MNRMISALLCVILVSCGCTTAISDETSIIAKSRANCVRILINGKTASGSGFFLDAEHIATCFHVIAKINVTRQPNQPLQVKYDLHPGLVVETVQGQRIPAVCISQPTQADASPFLRDFAVLRLQAKPKTAPPGSTLYPPKTRPNIGNTIVFSGYPLNAPTMLTHRGMVSGEAPQKGLICLQAPVNKGCSGSAVLNAQGQVIAIVNAREGGISQGLDDLRKFIMKTESKGRVSLMGVDPLQASKEIVNVLDRHISTGIGYAVDARFLSEYASKQKLLKKCQSGLRFLFIHGIILQGSLLCIAPELPEFLEQRLFLTVRQLRK